MHFVWKWFFIFLLFFLSTVKSDCEAEFQKPVNKLIARIKAEEMHADGEANKTSAVVCHTTKRIPVNCDSSPVGNKFIEVIKAEEKMTAGKAISSVRCK